MKERSYDSFVNEGPIYLGQQKRDTIPELPAGVYELVLIGQNQTLAFKQIQTNHDTLVDIPDAAYNKITKEIELFLKPETKAKFRKHGLLYKRSSILHGIQGTGKTCIVNKVAQDVMAQGGVVIFNPHLKLLKDAFQQLTAQTLVVLEEFDSYVHSHESELLSLLDGEIQKDNVIFLATTNYFEEVPPRLLRPGRFSSIIEVGMPTTAAREAFLKAKTDLNEAELKVWLEQTEGFSIDELTECIRACVCLNYTLEETIDRLKKLKEMCNNDLRQKHHASRIKRRPYFDDEVQEAMFELAKGNR